MRAAAHRRWSWAAAFAASLLLAHTAAGADINWAEVEKQATDFLRAYIQINTSNPPGNEIAAARFLADRFRQAGIDAEVFESEPGRGSVLARVKGNGGVASDRSAQPPRCGACEKSRRLGRAPVFRRGTRQLRLRPRCH